MSFSCCVSLPCSSCCVSLYCVLYCRFSSCTSFLSAHPLIPVYCLPPACLCWPLSYYLSLVCTLVPPPSFLTHKRFLLCISFLSATLKVCCLLSHLSPLSPVCCPLSALPVSTPPPHPNILHTFQCQGLQTARPQGHREKHAITNKNKTAIFK